LRKELPFEDLYHTISNPHLNRPKTLNLFNSWSAPEEGTAAMARLRLLLLIPLACLTNTLVLAQYSAYNYGFDVTKRVKRQLSQRSTMVVNDKSGSGNVVVRQEIRQLEQDQDLWTLYILGLSMLQFTDQSSPTSYYGLAGLCFLPAIAVEYQRAISDCLS
jgi:hypothetical protein